ncbi:sensor histidine kinase [Thermopolyspora sp. NPDC052614]|uniref:sensor histidine kinase n=1 Tax=Thermopolyspora sp. NPDC052614 TaxID=3155682 RepID=UPI0034182286
MGQRARDALIAAVVMTLCVGGTYGNLSNSGMVERPLATVGLLLLLVSSAVLAFRHVTPLAVGLLTVACCVAYYAIGYPGIFAGAPPLVAIFTAATLGRRRLSVTLAVALAVGIAIPVALADTDPKPGGIGLISGWLVATVIAGEVTRNRRAYLREAERRAAEAERTRDEAALRRASEERLWIAQELHDTLTHAISVINVQAAVATHLLDRKPEQAREALAAIRESGQEAMRELRGTLKVLRQADQDGMAAGLDGVPRLAARAEAAGIPVEVVTKGERRELSQPVDRAAYRIVQEALTNVLRHAGGASATITMEYGPDTVTVRVEDDGRNEPEDIGQGMGLIGMRERAVAVGGSLTAGPRAGGGFAVRAELPLGNA